MEEPKTYRADDLVGTAELASSLGVSRQAVAGWMSGRARPGMPAPIRRLRATPVWSLSEIRAWYFKDKE